VRPVLAPAPDRPPPRRPPASFSIVLAAYQSAATIGEALASAVGQTLPPLEIVVCDDGSTDDLDSALAPYLDRIVLLRQENGGAAAAKTAAARAARGEFVAILDADDIYLPERLEALAELASARPDLDVLTTDAIVEVDGVAVRRCYDESWTFEVDDQRGAILERNFVFGLAAVRRELLLAAGGFDHSLRYATDWDLWCRLILDGSRVGLVAEPLARYRLRRASLSAQRGALLRGRCRVLEKAALRTDLTPAERGRLDRALAEERRRALLTEAHEALLAGTRDARGLALRVAVSRSTPFAGRFKALAAVVAPRFAARRLRRGRERFGIPGPAGLRLPT
jgi:Glycosyl transferase family 2